MDGSPDVWGRRCGPLHQWGFLLACALFNFSSHNFNFLCGGWFLFVYGGSSPAQGHWLCLKFSLIYKLSAQIRIHLLSWYHFYTFVFLKIRDHSWWCAYLWFWNFLLSAVWSLYSFYAACFKLLFWKGRPTVRWDQPVVTDIWGQDAAPPPESGQLSGSSPASGKPVPALGLREAGFTAPPTGCSWRRPQSCHPVLPTPAWSTRWSSTGWSYLLPSFLSPRWPLLSSNRITRTSQDLKKNSLLPLLLS